MRFNLGEIWKSNAEDGGSRRGAVVEIDDDGRRGKLYFADTGDEEWFVWAQLTQFGKWQVDTSPKPLASADDLKAMILKKIGAHPVCPAGMSVEIRGTSENDWEALSVPPPGSNIAYADCAHYIATIAQRLRLLYGVHLFRVEASSGAGLEWTSSLDSAATIARTAAERQRNNAANIMSGPTEVVPPLPGMPLGMPPVLRSALENMRAGFSAEPKAGFTDATSTSVDVDRVFAERLSERTVAIAAAARRFAQAIKDQIEYLNSLKANEPAQLRRETDVIDFLEGLASDLDELADALDRAIAAGAEGRPEPILLGKAGEIARALASTAKAGLERNRNYIVDCTIKFTVFAAGFLFLRECGVDGVISGIVAGLMNVMSPKSEHE